MAVAIIVCNGENIRRNLPEGFIICADGGLKHMKSLGRKPDCILGDMDSADPEELKGYENITILLDDQNTTDSEKAILYAISRGFDKIILTGASGSRVDHTINNLFLLEKYRDIDIRILDENNEIFIAKNRNVLDTKEGDVISLIPLEAVSGLSLKGLRYEADRLDRTFTGVHNIATGTKAEIDFRSGVLLINRIQNL